MQTDTRDADQSRKSAIAAEVRAEMARQQITQRDLADKVGMFQQALQVRLAGARSFRAEELAAVAAALGVDIHQFLPPVVDPDLSTARLAGGAR